jgi:MoxR-like ATPase
MEENTSTLDIRAINEKIEESAFIDLLTMEMNKVIVGQKHMNY